MMKKHVLPYVIALLVLSCGKNEKITNPADYEIYFENNAPATKLAAIDSEISFWQKKLDKIDDDIVSRSKLAGLLERRFFYSGKIIEVHQADSLYKLVNRIQSKNSSGIFRALASNSIKQHKFKQAQLYIDSALYLGDDRYLSLLMQFDIAMELGNKVKANEVLNSLGDKKNFDYLIRAAKYKDHIEGNLDEAIELMEKALKEVETNNTLLLWTKSNLGDLYGHANRMSESYRCYLDVLSKDPEYYHALKGIAWLVFSGDKNPAEAKRIIVSLKQRHNVPDYDLLLAEIAEFENAKKERDQHFANFLRTAADPLYGDMYSKYVFNLKADVLNHPDEALSIAKKEVENRPTPEAFSWLAWAYLKKGEVNQAVQIAKAKVENKSFEPEVVYRMGMIYKNSGQKNKAKQYLNDAKSSHYELGPVVVKEISTALHSL
jgi:tetratricopeptide (TPR) repeat protein